MAEKTKTKTLPPHAPCDAVLGIIDGMAKTDLVPGRVDTELMPTLSGGTRAAVLTALRYLGLIDASNHPTPSLEKLVDAKKEGGEAWHNALAEVIKVSYDWAFEGLDVKRATAKQLRERFNSQGVPEGIMIDRTVRFFLKALEESAVQFSPLLKARKARGTGTVAKRAKRQQNENNEDASNATNSQKKGAPSNERHATDFPILPKGMISFPIHLPNKMAGSLILPSSVTTEDCKMVELVFKMVQQYAAQNSTAEQ